MNKSLVALAVVGVSMASAYAAPHAGTIYVGTKAGWASLHGHIDQIDAKKVGHGHGFGIHRHSPTYGVFAGYQLVNHLALEAGYDYFGRLRGSEKVGSEDQVAFKHTAHGASLSLKGDYALTRKLDGYLKAGLALVNNRYKLNLGEKQKDSQNALLLGAGLEYAFSPAFAGRVEYQWLQNAAKAKQNVVDYLGVENYRPSIQHVSAGVTYRFGQGNGVSTGPEKVSKRFAFGADVLFDFGKANLKPAAIVALEDAHEEMERLALVNPSIEVSGYTDRIGRDQGNLVLSQRRAESVANYIVSKGVNPENITAVGYGKANPVTGNTCDAVKARTALINCLAPDRRVELQIQGSKEIVM